MSQQLPLADNTIAIWIDNLWQETGQYKEVLPNLNSAGAKSNSNDFIIIEIVS